jgi:hypothetical protein
MAPIVLDRYILPSMSSLLLHTSDEGLRQRYPLLRPGDDPDHAWEWRSKHGPASVLYFRKLPRLVLNARIEDGSRARIGRADGAPGWRRVAAPPLRYQWGTVEIREDDVLFFAGSIHRYEPPPLIDENGMPSLEGHLGRDQAFIDDLRDRRLAHVAWQILAHADLVRWDAREFGFFGGDAAAAMIAGLRALGEDGSDFNLYDAPPGEPDERELGQRVFTHLGRLGWRRPTPSEWHERQVEESRERLARRVKTLRKVREFEARPACEPGAWIEDERAHVYDLPLVGKTRWSELGELSDEEQEAASYVLCERIVELARTGRVNLEEYRRLTGGLGFKFLGHFPYD